MSNLDNIVDKILLDAEAECNKILNEANEKKDSYIDQKEKEAIQEKNQIISKSKDEAEAIVEKALNNANIKARDKILDAKQIVMAKALAKIKDGLRNLDENTYVDMLKGRMKTSNISDKYIVMIQKDKLEAVKKLGLKNIISDKYVDSGFSFVDENSVLNNDFSNLVDYMQDDLEVYIAEKLFVD